MPDIVVHNMMGDDVLERLPENIRAGIDSDAFHVGVLGPDPYFFYRFFAPHFRHGIDERGAIMHHSKTNRFLMELARQCGVTKAPGSAAAEQDDGNEQNTQAAPDQQFSEHDRKAFGYFCGFLCHYALDSTVHPYINMLSARRVGMHTAIERKLDRLALRKKGLRNTDIMKFPAPYPDIPEIRAAMKNVFGWDDDYFKVGYRHMKLFLWIVKDEHGMMDNITGSSPAKFEDPSPEEIKKIAERKTDPDYKQKIKKGSPVPIPKRGFPGLFAKLTGKRNYQKLAAFGYRNHFCDEIDMNCFDELQKRAEDYAVKLITTAYDCRAGKASRAELAALIGNRTYSGDGLEEW